MTCSAGSSNDRFRLGSTSVMLLPRLAASVRATPWKVAMPVEDWSALTTCTPTLPRTGTVPMSKSMLACT